MARKPRNTPEAEPVTLRDPLDTALGMIATSGWRSFSLVELARELGVPLGEVYRQFPSRAAVLDRLGRRLDQRMLELAAIDLDDMSVRERLFELIMRRFDVMKPYRDVLVRLARESRGDLAVAGVSLGNMTRAVGKIIDAAGIRGPGLLLAHNAVSLLYLRLVRIWLQDDDPEQARLLAELDKGLARLEEGARRLCRFMPRRRAAAPDVAAA
ncbi:TetR/AcrR family transcriptional regulator [Geminicoccus flavidas]|uniref:TetR/AcrR family transcriptional regulator n=1 Tax=Geminicoccus flavidas TaxID=2506407 RepID=UPI001356CDCD|nr:TetR family transcriptional regulator [Geminicoccus flavidas]